ncbi:MAG: outer membrane protein assembly factor BamE [Pseudomonadota bacterium]
MQRLIHTALLTLVTLALCGCGLIYKIDIQQGSILDQDMVNDLRPGMTKRQVSLVLGTPAVESPFRHDRWNYVNTYSRRGGETEVKTLNLTFENNRLTRIEGDYKPDDSEVDEEESSEDESANSP